ncbi:MAG: hypothetical protein L0338_22440 [Acidobacteria bacterium]|nr:hypothetical protein [Acidobacteriota bacterium]
MSPFFPGVSHPAVPGTTGEIPRPRLFCEDECEDDDEDDFKKALHAACGGNTTYDKDSSSSFLSS